MINRPKRRSQAFSRFESDVVLDSDKSCNRNTRAEYLFESDVVLDSDKSCLAA